jgi:hypothetical protein
MKPSAEAKARALAEAVLNRQSVRWPVDQARALLAAPERPALDREALAALICEWNEGDALHRPTEEEVRLADFILARLEADRGK